MSLRRCGRWRDGAHSVAQCGSAPRRRQSSLSAGPNRFRLSRDLNDAIDSGRRGRIDVIVSGAAADVQAAAARHGARVKKVLDTGVVLDVDAESLDALSNDSALAYVSSDPIVRATMAVTDPATGADQAAAGLVRGLRGSITGRGITVALIDSGVIRTDALRKQVVAAVDFTSARGQGVDEYGHGTHVAGIIGGSADGFQGIAPGVKIVSLKVLAADGSGATSDVIAAIDWSIRHRFDYDIRIINLSLGHPVFDSYVNDPLDQAVERAYRAGILVVAAAGNLGKTPDGVPVVGGITAPGNSPFALTVGATDTKGTIVRSDDAVASWSSRGPTYQDSLIKPDLVAPGTGIWSLAAPGSTLVTSYPDRVSGGLLKLSGTSMSTGVVSGAAALVLQANPRLTPSQVRLTLQLSSTFLTDAGLVGGGAGSLNIPGALQVAVKGPDVSAGERADRRRVGGPERCGVRSSGADD